MTFWQFTGDVAWQAAKDYFAPLVILYAGQLWLYLWFRSELRKRYGTSAKPRTR